MRIADRPSRSRRAIVLFGAIGLLGACATTPPHPGSEPPRRVELEQTRNTRDLGGYATADGRSLRWGLIFRSDELARLSEDDVDQLATRELRTVFDLRGEHERVGREDRVPSDATVLALPISYPSMDPDQITSRILSGDAPEGYFENLLMRANRSFALDHGEQIARLIQGLSQPGGLPALLHCTYGKDRTGFASAMVLELLGVPWETVVDDYLLSNVYLSEHITRMARFIWLGSLFRISMVDARDLLEVRQEYIESAREAVFERYGSTEAYVKAFGVSDDDLERLREALIE